MKTTNITTANIENLTVGQLKAIALMQFNIEDYFMFDDEDTVKIYEGTEEEAKESYEEAVNEQNCNIDFVLDNHKNIL